MNELSTFCILNLPLATYASPPAPLRSQIDFIFKSQKGRNAQFFKIYFYFLKMEKKVQLENIVDIFP